MPLKDFAIKAAVKNDWEQALLLNQKILEEYPQDIDSLNRLAFALIKLGKLQKAKDIYKQVLQIDKTNPIALRNLKRIACMPKQKKVTTADTHAAVENLFIEEAGKTKIVKLKNVTDRKTLSFLQPGDYVELAIKRSKIFVQMYDRKYIGMLPDQLGVRLLRFIQGGNEYSAFIKAIGDKNVTIFIKEVKKATRYKNQPSFTLATLSSSYARSGR